MKTTDDNLTASDIINFKAGVELGYSLGTWNEDAEVLKSVNALVFRYQNHPFCRGLRGGFDKANLDKKLAKDKEIEERMDDVFKIHNEQREQNDLER